MACGDMLSFVKRKVCQGCEARTVVIKNGGRDLYGGVYNIRSIMESPAEAGLV